MTFITRTKMLLLKARVNGIPTIKTSAHATKRNRLKRNTEHECLIISQKERNEANQPSRVIHPFPCRLHSLDMSPKTDKHPKKRYRHKSSVANHNHKAAEDETRQQRLSPTSNTPQPIIPEAIM